MTETHPLVRSSSSIFAGMPAPVLFVVTMFLVMVLGADLLLPDAIPLLDEAVLAWLLYGSTSALLGRRGAKELRPATEGISGRRLIKEAAGRAKEATALAKKLHDGGMPVRALGGVTRVGERVSAQCAELAGIDAFLSRRENDPWQVQREVAKLERQVAEAEAGGEQGRMESLQVALEGARMHAHRVAEQTAERDRVVGELRAVTSQLSTLIDTLKLADDAGAAPALPAGLGASWDPELAAVLEGLREVAVAQAELDEAAEQATGGRVAARRKDRDLA